MGVIQSKYDDTQRDAVRRAGCDLGMSPGAIADAAEKGQLTLDGALVPAFEIPASTARYIIRTEVKKRAGRARSELLKMPHKDAMEELRCRMLAVVDHETKRLADAQRSKPKDAIDGEHFRKLCRGLRELASLPDGGGQAPRPGANVPGQGPPTGEALSKPDSMRGRLEAAINRAGPPGGTAQDDPLPDVLSEGDRDDGLDGAAGEPRAQTENPEHGGEGDGGPGAWARSQMADLTATHVDGQPVGA